MMLTIKNLGLLFIFMLILNACVTKEYTKQESIFIVFKTPTFKHADLGFMYENKNNMKVEMYSNGQAIMSLTINEETICMSLFECMDKQSFNTKVLSRHYSENILQNIFAGKAILLGKKRVNIRNGFTQNISKANKYNIEYKVLNKQIVFRDTMNNILIKVKRLER